MKFLDVFTEADRTEYGGEVRILRGELMIYGFLNNDGDFVELFAEGVFGRSHLACGFVHRNIPTADLELVCLRHVEP